MDLHSIFRIETFNARQSPPQVAGSKKMCVYHRGCKCVPKKNLIMCQQCPYGNMLTFNGMLGSIYGRIIDMAINVFKRDLSKRY